MTCPAAHHVSLFSGTSTATYEYFVLIVCLGFYGKKQGNGINAQTVTDYLR